MLRATPRHLLSWSFDVQDDAGRAIAEIDMAWFRERAEVTIDGEPYTVGRESMIGGTFWLRDGNEQTVARAEKQSVFTRTMNVSAGEHRFELRALSAFRRGFGVFRADARLGEIEPVSWPGRTARVALPDEVPLPVQVFMFWLVVIMWRRAASNASGGTT